MTGGVLGGVSRWQKDADNPTYSTGERVGRAAGATTSMGAAAALGAGIGSIVPGAGTLVGAAAGLAVGAVAGYVAGEVMDDHDDLFVDAAGDLGGWVGDVFGIVGLLFFTAAIFLIFCFFKDPQWFRPKWYKGWDDRNIDPNFWGYADLAGMPTAPDQDSELAARNTHFSEELWERRGLCRLVGEEWGRPTKQHMNGVVEGAFLFYPSALVFCADSSDDNLRGGPTVREVAASEIRDVTATSPDEADRGRGRRIRFGQVLLHTADGPPWRIEVLRRKRFMADVRRCYMSGQGPAGGDSACPGR